MNDNETSNSNDFPTGEQRALQALARLLREVVGLRLAAPADRDRTLRDFGLLPAQVAYIAGVLKRASVARNHAIDLELEGSEEIPDLDPEAFPSLEFCPIAWRPTILTPVFWGRELVFVGDVPVTIYYPSLDGSPDGASMLKNCGDYSLLLFLHGHCQDEPDHVYRWERHLAQLARCGFVVAAPFQRDINGGPATESVFNSSLEVLEWMRTTWSGRMHLHGTTGVFGHSYGAMLAGRVAVAANVRAYASLSADWDQWSPLANGLPEPLQEVTMPSLHMWGTGFTLFPDELSGPRWDSIPGLKHRVVLHDGDHWEYLQGQNGGCAPPAVRCGHLGSSAGDLVACFFARYLPPGEHESGLRIPISLRPPEVPLTPDQEFYAGGHLGGLKMLPFSEGCEITSAWETASGNSGSVTLGSPS